MPKNDIKYISVFSHNNFDEKMYRLGIDTDNVENETDKAFISIIGTPDCQKYYLEEDECHWFKNNTDNVLNLEFDDIGEEELEYKGVLFKGLTDEQAEQIVDFIEKNKGKNWYIHCRAGKSRSCAIGTYILDMYGEENGYYRTESTKRGNALLTPNIFVLTKLKRIYYKKYLGYE